jgi:hypothetical protein
VGKLSAFIFAICLYAISAVAIKGVWIPSATSMSNGDSMFYNVGFSNSYVYASGSNNKYIELHFYSHTYNYFNSTTTTFIDTLKFETLEAESITFPFYVGRQIDSLYIKLEDFANQTITIIEDRRRY